MDWTSKANAIILISIICLAGIGVAGTAYFDNKTDALAALNDPITITKDKCRIITVEETIDTNGSKGIKATIEVGFFKPNWDRRLNNVTVSSTNPATIEAETAKPCDELWKSIQAESQFQSIDTVIVDYTQTESAGILEREYDLDKKTWANTTTEIKP